ncbi:hypothetical protein PPUJ20005_38320 [Pseudomonas putida]|nr:hypothetical protein PPUJ20005_38320 [Pseudomonas putida]
MDENGPQFNCNVVPIPQQASLIAKVRKLSELKVLAYRIADITIINPCADKPRELCPRVMRGELAFTEWKK